MKEFTKFCVSLVFCFQGLYGLNLTGQVSQAWLARYSPPDCLTNEPAAVLTDRACNVHVTSVAIDRSGEATWVTAKYGPSGNQLWAVQHRGGQGTDDRPTAMVVDQAGNIIVTGYCYNLLSGSDYVTVKYGPDGTLRWVQSYNGPGNGNDQAKAVAVDPAGNIYVTGTAYVGSTAWPAGTTLDSCYATIKYDPAGNVQWVRHYAASGATQDAQAIALDPEGNVYVAGISVFFADPRSPGAGFAVVKYGADGSPLGVCRYDSFSNTDGTGARVGLALGRNREIHLGGTIPTSGPPTTYTVVKYGTNGVQAWAQRYYGPNPYGSGGNRMESLQVDSSGNVYVTGSSVGTNNFMECATVKYSREGAQLWSDRYSHDPAQHTVARSLTIDPFGYAYITADCGEQGNSSKCATLKYAPDGTRVWEALYAATPSGRNRPKGLALDSSSAVLVTGSASHTNAVEGVLIKYVQQASSLTQLADGALRVVFPALPGSTNWLQFSTDLRAWQNLGSTVATSSGICVFEDTRRSPRGFYRCVYP